MKVIAFVNCSSGGNQGEKVHAVLSDLLGPDNVFDIKKDGGPGKGLDLHCGDRDGGGALHGCGRRRHLFLGLHRR